MVVKTSQSIITFDPAQQRLFNDPARVIVVNWHRQKGKDFTTAAKAIDTAIRTGENWYIVSLTQRQADATFEKCILFADIYRRMLKMHGEIKFSETEYLEYDKWLDHTFTCTKREIHFPNGAKVVSLPGRDPDTLAGLTGNVIFTEFGLFPNGGYDHWRVVFPLTTRGFRCIIISTPRGMNSKFHELCHSPELYSIHHCDIYESIAEGFVLKDQNGDPCDLETFKKLYGDPIGFKREYGCEFMGDLEALVKWSQLQIAGELGRDEPFDLLHLKGDSGWDESFFQRAGSTLKPGERLEIGWDVARRNHLSSLFCNVSKPGQTKRLRYLVLMQDCSFALMRNVVQSAMNTTVSSVGCGDATGLGMESNEVLASFYGDRWQPVTFTATSKTELGSLLATTFDDRGQTLPPLDGEHKFIATDIYAIQKEYSGNRLKLSETENPLLPDSHCDIAYSAALALKAGSVEAFNPNVSFV